MVHADGGILKDKDELAGEWIDREQTNRLIAEEAARLRNPKTGLIDEDEVVDAVAAREEEMLHKHAPKRFPPLPKKAKKSRKRMKNRSGGQIQMLKDLTIEDLERMRGPEYLGEQADTLIWAIRTTNPGVPEEKLRKMTVEQAFADRNNERR